MLLEAWFQNSKLRTDQWPLLDAFRRGWNRQVTRTQISGECLHAIQGAQAKPRRRPDDNSEINDGENCRREPRAAAEQLGKKVKYWMERDGEYDTPGQYGHKGLDQKERPVDQEGEQPEADSKLDDVLSGQELAKSSQDARLPRVAMLPAKLPTAPTQ